MHTGDCRVKKLINAICFKYKSRQPQSSGSFKVAATATLTTATTITTPSSTAATTRQEQQQQ